MRRKFALGLGSPRQRVQLVADALRPLAEVGLEAGQLAEALANQTELGLDVDLRLEQQLAPPLRVVGLAEFAPDLGARGLGLQQLRELLEREAEQIASRTTSRIRSTSASV